MIAPDDKIRLRSVSFQVQMETAFLLEKNHLSIVVDFLVAQDLLALKVISRQNRTITFTHLEDR